jgi:membrane protein YdbS with pleckstrin-like domain
MQIAQSETRKKYPLSSKKILKKAISNSIVLTIIFLCIWVFVSFIAHTSSDGDRFPMGSFTVGIVFLLLLVWLANYLYQRWYFAVYSYDLTNDFIIIKKGPITPVEITIPYERVQDVYVDQDIFDRLLGLYDVHLSSATVSSGMEAHIDGVAEPAANGLRDLLLETVHSKIRKQ